jgi:hypothetical protein
LKIDKRKITSFAKEVSGKAHGRELGLSSKNARMKAKIIQ